MNARPRAFAALSLFDEESVAVVDGELQWIPLRRRLGIGAFGTNAYRAAHSGDLLVEDHVESPGQEELYLVVRGRAEFAVGEETLEAPAGTAIFLPDPEVRRAAVALADETVVLAVGGWRDRPYHSLPWEPIFLAEDLMRRGEWAAAVQTLEREAGDHRDSPFVRFHVARCRARLGEDTAALEELRRAIEKKPEMLQRAEQEESFEGLRRLPGWPARSG
jgi:hypothetical protein